MQKYLRPPGGIEICTGERHGACLIILGYAMRISYQKHPASYSFQSSTIRSHGHTASSCGFPRRLHAHSNGSKNSVRFFSSITSIFLLTNDLLFASKQAELSAVVSCFSQDFCNSSAMMISLFRYLHICQTADALSRFRITSVKLLSDFRIKGH